MYAAWNILKDNSKRTLYVLRHFVTFIILETVKFLSAVELLHVQSHGQVSLNGPLPIRSTKWTRTIEILDLSSVLVVVLLLRGSLSLSLAASQKRLGDFCDKTSEGKKRAPRSQLQSEKGRVEMRAAQATGLAWREGEKESQKCR